MTNTRVAKVTISLQEDLLNMADRLAKDWSTTRSGVVAALLRKEEEAQFIALMEEGYREIAEESLRFAQETAPYVEEMMRTYAPWDEEQSDKTG